MIQYRKKSFFLYGLLGMFPLVALAHQEVGVATGFVSGFLHPLFGLDHVVAMVAVGLLGAIMGPPALWLLPVVFPLVMAFGGVLGVIGVPVPGIEIGIALSGIVLGLLVAFAIRPQIGLAAILVGAFAIFHGHAHGTELPEAASPLAYGVGFVIATGMLHLSGIAVEPTRTYSRRFPEEVTRVGGPIARRWLLSKCHSGHSSAWQDLMTDIKKQSESTQRTPFNARLFRALPGLQVLRDYQRADLGPDVLSGLVICLVLIPSVLAYAELAGSGPVGGIYAAVAATIAYFLFASSRHMNVGPDGAVALLAGVVILPLTGGDPGKALIASAWLAVFTGIILVAAAALRLGIVASFLSTPVLMGYLNGAAFVIIVSQWGKLFGIELEQERFILRLIEWIEKVGDTHTITLAVGVGVIVLLFIAKWLIPRLPPLVPIFFIVFVASYFIDFKAMEVGVIGEIRELTPSAVGFTLQLDDIAKLAVGALGLAMLIFPEGVLLGRAMAEKHDYEVNADRELFALGSANLASGAFLGFSVGGSQTRTLLNSASGGRTQVANLVSAILLVVFIVFAADWLTRFPKVAIAAILVYTGFSLIDIAGIRRLWIQHRKTAWIAITTMAAVVFVGVLPGILLGTAMSIAILLVELARPHDALLGRLEDSDDLHDVGDDEKAIVVPGLLAYRFYGPLIFANVSYFVERLQGFIDAQEQPVKQVLLDASAIPSIDYTAAEKLQPFLQKLSDQGIELAIARAHLPLREIELGNDMDALFPDERVFATVAEAVVAFEARVNPQ